MIQSASRISLLGFWMLLVSSPLVAAPIGAGNTVLPGTAIQDITLLPGTPFNPTSSPILLNDISGVGFIVLHRDAQTGSTIVVPSFSGGQFFGSHPALGSYVFGNIAPLTGADFSGQITNVVQNPADPGFPSGNPSSFLSGDFSFGGDSFGFEFLTGPAAGIKLFTDPSVPFQFSAFFDGLPPSAGTVLVNSGPEVLDVLFGDIVVAQSSDRRIVLSAVPEPSGLMLLGCGLASLCVAARRRQRRN